jgi:hypothetical protein
MKRFLITVGLMTALVAAAAVQPARSASSSKWYWTPGACKYELKTNGVQIADGRTYSVQAAFCVGLHNHCWLSDGVRRYKVFDVVVRSYDGVVRLFQLTVTGQHTWTGTPAKMLHRYMSASQFTASYGPAAWSVATQENQGGCYDIHP